RRFTRTRTPAAAIVTKAVLRVVTLIRVTRPILGLDVRVVPTALIFLPDHSPNARTPAPPLAHPLPHLQHICLASLLHQLALPRPPPRQIHPNRSLIHRDSRRATIDNHDVSRPM